MWNARSQAAMPLASPLTGIMGRWPDIASRTNTCRTKSAALGMSDYIARLYWRDSVAAFTTFVSYYERQTQGKTIHSPRELFAGCWMGGTDGRNGGHRRRWREADREPICPQEGDGDGGRVLLVSGAGADGGE